MDALVVFYSRTGTARRVAQEIAQALHCETEEIVDERDRRGLLGYLRCSLDSLLGRSTSNKPLSHDPSRYDLVIVGSPIWDFSVSTPVRTFLESYRGKLRAVAFFVTCGGSGSGRVLRQMAEASGKEPRAELVLKASEVRRGRFLAKVLRFVEAIGGSPTRDRRSEPLHA